MDMSHSFYYKYKRRIYRGGRRNKVILTCILRLHVLPPPSPLTATSISTHFYQCSKNICRSNNLNLNTYVHYAGYTSQAGPSKAILSQHSTTPGPSHFAALNCIFHYLCGVSDMKLIYCGKPDPLELSGYVNADWEK
jgi:hypothetical protein